MLELGIAAASAFAIGFGVVLLLWPGTGSPRALAVKVFLSLGLGQGVTSCLTFVFLIVHGRPDTSYRFYELIVLLALVVVLIGRRHSGVSPAFQAEASGAGRSALYEWILAAALLIAATAALGALLIWMYRAPYGQWDAWAIYNLRARSIFRGGNEWRDAFSLFLYRSHPDYPLLLPSTVIRAWMFTGNETMLAPRAIAGLFAVAIVGLVVSAVALLRGRTQAYIAGIALLGNVFLIENASAQYADLPVMFFYTAAVILLLVHANATGEKRNAILILVGLAAGLAAWSKNEGLLFVVVVLVAHFAVVLRSDGWREYARQARFLAFGLLPVMLIVVYFKLTLAPPSDLAVMTGKQSLVAKLVDPGRYLLIASEFSKRIVPHEPFGFVFAFALAFYAVCARLGPMRTRGVALGGLVFLLLFGGYVAVYVATPYPLAWHLFTSVDRILLQLWPMFVVVFFLVVATPEEMLRSTALGRSRQET